jgi:hypothetical protein
MDLEDILYDSSRRTAEIAVSAIGNNPDIFEKFFEYAMLDKGRFAMRAARVIQLASHRHPELIRPYMKEIIQKLPFIKTEGLKRGFLKILTERSFQFDEETMGILVTHSFEILANPAEKPAMKVYALEILYSISKYYPDIKPELISSIENLMPRSSAAVKSVGKRLLKKLYFELQ